MKVIRFETVAVDILNAIAKHAHEINRAYCAAIGDFSQVRWEAADEWQRESARRGVKAFLSGKAKTPEEQHAAWMADKIAAGWRFGVVKDPVAKTHPCLVPYADLPPEQRVKDQLFRAAVIGACELATGGRGIDADLRAAILDS